MGRAIYSIMMVGALLGLVACGGGSSDENRDASGGQVAVTPNSADCLAHGYGYDGRCNTDYGQYQGFAQYPLQNGNYYGYENNFGNGKSFCGCPTGYQPTYNSSWGLGCVQTTTVSNWSYQSYGYSYYSSYQASLNIQQTSYQTYPTGGNCYNSLSYACDTQNQASCGHGGYCRPTGGAGRMGLCVYPEGYNKSYGNNNDYYNNGYDSNPWQ